MIDILLVEDHRELAQLLISFLERDGFQVHHVVSGEEALLFLQEHDVALLLLDIMLPRMDGFAVCRRIREQQAVPILIMSARKDRSDQLNGYELGADDYIEKPVDPQILAVKIRAVLQNAGKTLRKEYIFARIWGMDSFSEQQTLTVHIKMLRDKIEKDPKRPQLIKTVWGVGYRFEEI